MVKKARIKGTLSRLQNLEEANTNCTTAFGYVNAQLAKVDERLHSIEVKLEKEKIRKLYRENSGIVIGPFDWNYFET